MMGLTRFDPTPDPLSQHIPLSPCCFQGRVYCNYPRTGYFPFSHDLPQACCLKRVRDYLSVQRYCI